MDRLEIAGGWLNGYDPDLFPPDPRISPRQALEELGSGYLSRPPCLLAFSGSRDSSALLAVVVSVARREGLPLPIPVTLTYPGAAGTDELNWQHLVLDHCGSPNAWCSPPTSSMGAQPATLRRRTAFRHRYRRSWLRETDIEYAQTFGEPDFVAALAAGRRTTCDAGCASRDVSGEQMVAEAADGRVDPLEIFREERRRKPSPWALPRVTRSALRLVWQASRAGFLTAAFFQILGAVMATALVLASKLALDALLAAQNGTADTTTLVPIILLIAVVTAVSAASAALQTQQQRLLGEHVSGAVWDRMLDVTGRVSLEFFESPRFFEQLKRVELNSIARPVTVTTAIFGLLGGILGAAGLFIALLAIEPLLVPLLFVAGVPAVLLTRRAARTEFDFAVRYTPTARVRDYLRTLLTGREAAKEVRAFGAEPALRTRHDVANRRVLDGVHSQVRRRQRYAVAVVVCSAVVLAATLGLLLYFVTTRRVSVAGAGAAVVAVRLLSSRLDQLVGSIGTLFESSVFLEDLARFLALSVEADSPGTGTPAPHRHEIVLSGVSYTYPGSDRPAVDQVDLRIGAGEVIALVGENGSGKTTLAKLIASLYVPTGGSIRWDGVDTRELEPGDLRRSVAVIFQDFVRYQLSALENIGLGEPDEVEDESAARAAAVQAGAASFLETLPLGYQTMLSREYADGRDLSVGQWQRVALARAFRRDAPLVILDEPTAALDPRAEHALFADVRRLLRGRSALLISHRFSSVRTADRIYVMESGRIAERGCHKDLMAAGGLYAELFQLQARSYL